MVTDYNKTKQKKNIRRFFDSYAGQRLVAAVLSLGFLSLLVTGLGLAGYHIFSRSEFFRIVSINIEGNKRVDKKTILQLSGIDVQSNLLAINLESIEKKIQKYPWIRSAEVKREWPNVLHVKIRERQPEALLYSDDGLYYLDRYGNAFAKIELPGDLDFPVLTMDFIEDQGSIQLMEKSESVRFYLKDALEFLKYAGRGDSALPRQNISQIHKNQGGKVVLFLADRPFPIYFGGDMNYLKYKRLAKTLYSLYKRDEFDQVAYINLDYMEGKVLVGKIN